MVLSLRSLKSQAKKWGVSSNPWGRTVHVYCCLSILKEFSHSKAKRCWNGGISGVEKNAYLISSTLNQVVTPGVWRASYKGQQLEVYTGTTASLTSLRSCTAWYSLPGFRAGNNNVGVLQGDWQETKWVTTRWPGYLWAEAAIVLLITETTKITLGQPLEFFTTHQIKATLGIKGHL